MGVFYDSPLADSNLVLLCLAALCVYLPVSYYLNYRKCSGIKGPFLASISNLWLLRSTWNAQLVFDCARELDKYGMFVRIAPNKIVTNDPELWRLAGTPRGGFTRGTWYDSMTLDPNQKNSLAQRDDKLHNKIRAKLIRGYSGKEVPGLEATIDQNVINLVNIIRQGCASGKALDLARLCQFFTLDILTQIVFGYPVGFLVKNEDVYLYMEKISGFLGPLELTSNSPFIYSVMNSRIMAPFHPKPTDKYGMGAMLGVARKEINERFMAKYTSGNPLNGDEKPAVPQEDMLASFIRNGVTPEEAETETVLEILGGSDSTATAIRMTFIYIMTNPVVYAKIIAEIDAAKSANSLSQPVVRQSETHQHLPYLQACVKEGLRCFPPLVGLQGKVVPQGGLDWKGVHLPGGVEVCWNPHSMQRRPEIYGEDVDIYRPERWIEAAAESESPTGQNTHKNVEIETVVGTTRISRMNATLDLIFGAGKYGCLGKTVAWVELDKIFVALFDNFEFSLCNPTRPIDTASHGVFVQTNLMVKVRERNMNGTKPVKK